MFCKFCGNAVPDGASFCTSCGKPLKQTDAPAQQTTSTPPAPFVLLILLLCAPVVYLMGKHLLFRTTGLATVVWTETASLAVGLLLMGLLIWRKVIRMDAYSYADLLLVICADLLLPLLFTLESRVAQMYYGQNGLSAWALSRQLSPVIRLSTLWLMLGVIGLGVERTGCWRLANWQRVLLCLAPLIWTPIGVLLVYGRTMSMAADRMAETAWMLRQMLWMTSLFGWLESVLVMMTFVRLGRGRVGRIGAAAAMLGALIGECCLLYLLSSVMCLAIGLAIGVTGLGALLGWLMLFLATRLHTNRA